MSEVDQLLLDLQEEWGSVYVAYKGPDYFDGMECCLRNVTDEGLPVGRTRHEVEASTFSEALKKAHDRFVTE